MVEESLPSAAERMAVRRAGTDDGVLALARAGPGLPDWPEAAIQRLDQSGPETGAQLRSLSSNALRSMIVLPWLMSLPSLSSGFPEHRSYRAPRMTASPSTSWPAPVVAKN